jgi:hypothetical protein
LNLLNPRNSGPFAGGLHRIIDYDKLATSLGSGLDRDASLRHLPSSSDDIFAMIERLAKLRDAGAINDDEFTSKKTELLGRL